MDSIWPPETRNFIEIGSSKYQNQMLFQFNEPKFLSPSNVFYPGPFGGTLLHFYKSTSSREMVDVFSNSGNKMATVFNIKISGSISAFWFNNGTIGLLSYNGEIINLSLSGEILDVYRPPEEVESISCFYPFCGGIAFYTQPNDAFYIFDSSYNGFNNILEDRSINQDNSRAISVGYNNGIGYVVYENRNFYCMGNGVDARLISVLKFKPWFIYVSPNGDLAAATDGKSLFTGSAYTHIALPMISLNSAITSLAFVDDKTIAFVTNNELYFYQNGETKKVASQKIYFLIQDKYAIRVYQSNDDGENEMHIIAPLNTAILSLFNDSTSEKLEKLFKANIYFDQENVESYKILEELKPSLESIIKDLLAAVPHILDLSVCKRILSLASFGKYQIGTFDHNYFANVIQDIRVLNTLHSFEYSFTTLALDLQNMDKSMFLSIIVNCKYFELAYSFAKIYNLDKSIIAENWALTLIIENSGREIDLILKRVSSFPNVNFLRIAKIAKRYLSDLESIKKIIYYIRDPCVRMDFLLNNMKMDKEAIEDAIQSRDGNALITYLYTKKMLNQQNYGSLLSNYHQLADLYAIIKQQQENPPRAYTQIFQIPGYPALRSFSLELIYGNGKAFGMNNDQLNNALKLIERNNNPNNIWQQAVQNQMQLLINIQKLEDINVIRDKPTRSPRYWMNQAVVKNLETPFNKIAKIYKINDKAQAWIKIKAYEENHIWAALEQMSRRSQPLPWETFAEECFSFGRTKEALTFIDKVSNNENKLNILMKYECYEKAAQIAKKTKNEQLYNEIISNMNK